MKRTALHLSFALLVSPLTVVALDPLSCDLTPAVQVDTSAEPVSPGKFSPTWQSLSQYEVPEWFRDAKFGIWAHWGPQCEPEQGDWYARGMYIEGSGQNKYHVEHYGHPSEFGFKDVIHEWKAERWDPERLVKLYKKIGAQYFFALANHHDNLDLWDSKYSEWNSVDVGPHKNIIEGWAKAAREEGLPFGLSVHASHAWTWYEVAQGADKEGPYKGVPYDGNLTTADGKGKWWEGLNPQDLYAQNHVPSKDFDNPDLMGARWNFGNGASQPDQAYCERFYNRTMDLTGKYQPDLVYFDDTALPLWPVSDAGLKIAASFYNDNLAKSDGRSPGVLFGKVLNDQQRDCLVWDIERGVPATGLPYAWQTDTCLGSWHYNINIYKNDGYKSSTQVIHMLADIVSKNGNLLLSVPLRGDGTPDDKELAILEAIGEWMSVNKEAILKTRPWVTFGEGPASKGASLSDQGFNENKGIPFTAEDIRYTQSKDGKVVYAIVMGWPSESLTMSELATQKLPKKPISVALLGSNEQLNWKQTDKGLVVSDFPSAPADGGSSAAALKITLAR